MIPGGINPLMMAGGGDPLDELGVIARSLRFRASASPALFRVFGAPTNRKKYALRLCLKRGQLGAANNIAGAYGASTDYTSFYFDASDKLNFTGDFANANLFGLTTVAQFRDPAADLDIEFIFDSDNATVADRAQIWVNNVRQALTGTTVPVSATSDWNGSGVTHYLGWNGNGGRLDGCLSFVGMTDGQTPAQTSFAQVHPATNQWRPKGKAAVKAVIGASGNNSFFLPFDDPTTLTTLCADASSHGNNWTAVNISLTAGATYDSSLGTPTNNYSVLHTLANWISSSQPTISNGGLTIAGTAAGSGGEAWSSISVKSGNWYAEFVHTAITSQCGVYVDSGAAAWNSSADTVQYLMNGGIYVAGVLSTTVATFTVGDVIGVELNKDANTASFFKNDVLLATVGLPTNVPMVYTLFVGTTGSSATANFGQRPFVYPTRASGAKPLCTKNLKLPAIPKSESAFVARTDSGANIAAALAAARAGWPAYIDIIKRRDPTAEGWRWIFSDDPTNYIDSSSAAAKAAVPAFGGPSYAGYSLKVSALNGVATGTFIHINGVADTITDGLGNARKAIILTRESAGGGTRYFYHPDLTAGKLLYLEQTTAETTDATLGTVLSNSFVVAAALASGTYRWIALGEVPGFLSLNNYTANGSADGPFLNAGISPAFTFQKSTSGSAGRVKDIARTPNNPAQIAFDLNSSMGEDANSNTVDNVSNGFKERANDAMNVASQKYITLAIGQPFRYANAR